MSFADQGGELLRGHDAHGSPARERPVERVRDRVYELPGYDVVCDAEKSTCDWLVNGSGIAEAPRATVASCGF